MLKHGFSFGTVKAQAWRLNFVELGIFARWHTSDAASTIRLLGKMLLAPKYLWIGLRTPKLTT